MPLTAALFALLFHLEVDGASIPFFPWLTVELIHLSLENISRMVGMKRMISVS
jgi:hypothetical protein